MKSRHLVILAILVVVLVAARVVLNRVHRGEVARDLASAGLVSLVPSGLDAEHVTWVRVAGPPPAAPPSAPSPSGATGGSGATGPGSAPEATGASGPSAPAKPLLRVDRRDGHWVVTSAHDAPAEDTDVKEFVDTITALQGEVRGEGEKSFAAFGVDDAHALRVEVGKDGDQPALTLLVGKRGDGPGAYFVRVAGQDRVYHARADVRRELGAYADDAVPPADHWIKKVVLDVPSASIARMTIDRPDVRWVFARKPAPSPTGPSGASGPEPEPPRAEWDVSEPATGWPVQPDAVAGLAGRLGQLRIDSVLDPAATPACEIGEGATTITLEETSGTAHHVHLATKPAGRDDVLIRIDGDQHCYSATKWSLQLLLPHAQTIFQVPAAEGTAPAVTDIQRLVATREGQSTTLKHDGENWSIEGDGAADGGKCSRLAGALVGLHYDDVALADRVPADARRTFATVNADAKGRKLSVTLQALRPGAIAQDRYGRIEGVPLPSGLIGVVAGPAVDSLAPPPDELKKKS